MTTTVEAHGYITIHYKVFCDGGRFHWMASDGEESGRYFEDVQSAIDDVEGYYA